MYYMKLIKQTAVKKIPYGNQIAPFQGFTEMRSLLGLNPQRYLL